MRLIKLALISFVFLFLVVTAISLMIPSRVRISRAIDLRQSREAIVSYVGNQQRWPEWNPLAAPDTSGRVALPQVQTQSASDSELVYRLQQPGKKDIVTGWKLHGYSTTDTLTLQWYMDFRMSWYPWQKFGSLFYEGTYGKMMEKGLNQLKARLEEKGSVTP